jgi:alginate O-acetyltransferase complex protein AlgI
MSFTEPLFLFLFLPLVLVLHLLMPRGLRNALLLGASLLFYSWTQKQYLIVLLAVVIVNYVFARAIHRSTEVRRRRLLLWLAASANVLLLCIFKYPNFILLNLNRLLHLAHKPTFVILPRPIPLGLSFFSLIAMSYVIDVYREQIPAEKRLLRFASYLTLFPYVIAGPIVRYREVCAEFIERRVALNDFATGVRRFVIGLGKKILIANTLASTVNLIFVTPLSPLSMGTAWFGATLFALQIYFDISSYADMAIGLGLMLGFHLPENFNYPYTARSMTDFWQRWHITLVSWFRDYLFFPMSYRRSRWRIHLNLVIVFVLCGLWHEGSWRFIAWGLAHGSLLAFERMGLGRWLLKAPRFVGHAYVIVAVIVTGIFVRVSSLTDALRTLRSMAGLQPANALKLSEFRPNSPLLLVIVIAVIACLPLAPLVNKWGDRISARLNGLPAYAFEAGAAGLRLAVFAALLLVCAALSAAGTYKAFIYFQY